MAVVTDTISPGFTRTPFTKPPDALRTQTGMPRALVNVAIQNATITAKPVNDQAEVLISFTLPTEFAYRMVELVWSLQQDVADDWNSVAYMELINGIRLLPVAMTLRHEIAVGNTPAVPLSTALFQWTAVFKPPTYLIQVTQSGNDPQIFFKASNTAAAVGGAGSTNFYASFYEYDLEQTYTFMSHNPSFTFQRN